MACSLGMSVSLSGALLSVSSSSSSSYCCSPPSRSPHIISNSISNSKKKTQSISLSSKPFSSPPSSSSSSSSTFGPSVPKKWPTASAAAEAVEEEAITMTAITEEQEEEEEESLSPPPAAAAAAAPASVEVQIAAEAAAETPKGENVYAVVMIGSRQYIVIPGRFLYVQRLKGAQVNDKIVLNKVLLVDTRDKAYIGQPVVTNAVVHAVVEEQGLDEKVIVFKYKKKKNYRRNIGHRQPNTRIRITGITGYQDFPAETMPEGVPA